MNNVKTLNCKDQIVCITFNLTYICNFSCYYCVAGERNEKSFIFDENSKKRISVFIESIKDLYPNIEINFLLSGGEPLINKYFYDIVDFLLGFENVSILVTTNGFFIGGAKKHINILRNNKFSFYYTYHYHEYKRLDNNLKLIVNNVKFLKSEKIIFKLNFLIPTSINDFNDFKYRLDFIINETNLNLEEYELNFIREDGVISNNYNKEILDYYYNLKENKITEQKNDFVLTFLDDSVLNINYSKEVIEKGYNNFKGYICYPYSIPNNILLNHDLSIIFAGCSTMVNKVYSIEEAIEFMNKPNTKVICNSDYCTCGANIVIKKEYNEIINKNIKKLNDFILNKISSFMIIDGIDLVDIKFILDERKGFLISYKNQSSNIFLNFVIEHKQLDYDYMKVLGKFGIHNYKTNYQGGIVNDEITNVDNKINLIMLRIEKILPILSKVL